MILNLNTISWINPFTSRTCFVAWNGAAFVRVEDVAANRTQRNTRILNYDDLRKELLIMDDTILNRITGEKEIVIIR